MKNMLRKAFALLLCLCMLLPSVPAAFAEIRNDAAAPEEATANMYFSEQPEVSGVSAENDAPDEAKADGEAAPMLSDPNLKTGFATGTWGNLNWTLTDGTLKIMGFGPMADFRSGEDFRAWREHLDSITSVIIDGGVTCIGKYAFSDCSNVKEVDIPSSTTAIGERAFWRCTSLKSVVILSSVTSIGEGAFIGCISMESVMIQKGVTSINGGAFSGCSKLRSVTIPSSVTSMGEGAFSDCSSMESVTIRGGATCIGNEAFLRCTSLTIVTIPYSITRFGGSAFSGCTSLESVTIEGGVTDIPYHAFYGCSNLENVTIPNSVTVIQEGAFWKCTSLPSVTIPRSVTEILVHAFEGCSNLNDVYYEGSEAEWGMISPNDLASRPVTIHYNSTGPVKIESDNDGRYPYSFDENETLESLVFSKNSFQYNPRLARFLGVMARSAYTEEVVRSNYTKLGFNLDSDVRHGHYDDNTPFAGYYIGKKTLTGDRDGSILVLITIQGSKAFLNNQWLETNFNLGNDTMLYAHGWHSGFSASVEEIYRDIANLFGGKIPTQNVTYVITGHSLGAGTGNLLAIKLYEADVPNSNIYDYNFACPNVAVGPDGISEWNRNGVHSNIFNIGNRFDLVSYIPGILCEPGLFVDAKWNKYGVSYWFDNGFQLWWQPFGDDAHNMATYLAYLEKEYDESHFVKSEYKASCVLIDDNVDFEIYDDNNRPIIAYNDGTSNYFGHGVGDKAVLLSSGGKTLVYLLDDPENDDSEYNICYSSSSNLVFDVTFASTELNSGSILEEKSFNDVNISNNKFLNAVISKSSQINNTRLFVVDEYDVPILEVQEDGTEIPIPDDPVLGVPIDVGHFPDARFRAYIRENFDRDDPKNGYLSAEEIAQVGSINVRGAGITSLAGIKYFTSLVYLYCSDNLLKTLDLSGCTDLKKLYCRDNQLTKLGVSDCSALEVLDCANNGLTELELSGCDKVDSLQCSGNSLTILDISGCPSLLSLFLNGARGETDGVVSHRYDDGMYYLDHAPGLSYDAGVEIWAKAYPIPDFVTPADLSRIEEEAFAGCGFRCVELNEGLTYIGPRAFADCPNLAYMYIPESTTEIAPYAFGSQPPPVVYGKAGSPAEIYRVLHGYTFIAIS